MVYTIPHKNGDDWGMGWCKWHCFNHMILDHLTNFGLRRFDLNQRWDNNKPYATALQAAAPTFDCNDPSGLRSPTWSLKQRHFCCRDYGVGALDEK
jgi:hypothetical protein